jgi:hypothetical protein
VNKEDFAPVRAIIATSSYCVSLSCATCGHFPFVKELDKGQCPLFFFVSTRNGMIDDDLLLSRGASLVWCSRITHPSEEDSPRFDPWPSNFLSHRPSCPLVLPFRLLSSIYDVRTWYNDVLMVSEVSECSYMMPKCQNSCNFWIARRTSRCRIPLF